MPWSVQGSPTPSSIQLSYTSAHGEQGYPGVLVVTVRCSLDDNNVFRIEYEATSDRPTVVNLTNHSYFNLGGQDSGSVLGHELAIDADAFLPVKAGLIPTGEVRSVSGTPFDFRRGCAVGAHIGDRDEQLQLGGGYDHCFVLRGAEGESRRAARLIDPVSGRVMELHTTCPGLQLYTGNQLTGTIVGKAGRRYRRHDALCLEPQRFPNAPNVPWFPAAVLRAGERYRSATEYRFSNI